ncbi:MAG: hypothetical protein K2X77_23270 [Candidatus Obscuribacterales bacterium]|jgi:hypothetical protein|nr:hypothetical protein [Candidatus Obscuribacterales bacterium]
MKQAAAELDPQPAKSNHVGVGLCRWQGVAVAILTCQLLSSSYTPAFSGDSPKAPKDDSSPNHTNASTKNVAVKSANLEQVAFLKGTWRGTENGETTEEIWGSVLGDSIVGHCQSVSGNKTTLYELMAILKEGNSLVMRIKHFKGAFVPWKEEAESGDLKLIKVAKDQATFQNNKPERVTVEYKRAGEQLDAVVTVLNGEKTNRFPFRYKLVK